MSQSPNCSICDKFVVSLLTCLGSSYRAEEEALNEGDVLAYNSRTYTA